MIKLAFFFLISLAFYLIPSASFAYADSRCPDDLYYIDSRVGEGACIHKHAGRYDPGNKCTDKQGCVYAFNGADSKFCLSSPGSSPAQPKSKVEEVIGSIVPPDSVSRIGFGATGINNVVNKFIVILYGIAGVIFVFMVIASALQWIMSGGDKEAVGNARKRLLYAIIGIALLSLTFVILNTVGHITGFEFFPPDPACPTIPAY